MSKQDNSIDRAIRKAAGRKAAGLPGQQPATTASTQTEFDRVTVLIQAGHGVAEAEAQARAEFHAAPTPDGKAGAGTGNTLLTKPDMNAILRKAAGR